MEMSEEYKATVLYDYLRSVPEEAKKKITGGRLSGFTDINPMWRIKRLTELFGPCGLGWWYEITDKWLEGTLTDEEMRAFVQINLYYKWNGETSKPIPGLGGASFITKEQKGAYTSDECYKMALTDAISVAAKALGMAADVYYEKDRDKYTRVEEKKPEPGKILEAPPKPTVYPPTNDIVDTGPNLISEVIDKKLENLNKPQLGVDGYYHCQDCGKVIKHFLKNNGDCVKAEEIAGMTLKKYGRQLCSDCGAKYKNAN